MWGLGSSSSEFGDVLQRLCVSDVSIAVLSSSIMLLRGVIPGGGGILVRGGSVLGTCLTQSLTFWPIPCFGVVVGARNRWMLF